MLRVRAKRYRCARMIACCLLLVSVTAYATSRLSLAAEVPGEEHSSAPAAENIPSAPDFADIVPRAGRTTERLTQAQGVVGALHGVPVNAEVMAQHGRRVDELNAALDNLHQSKSAGYVQYADLKSAMRVELEDLTKLTNLLSSSLRRIDDLRGEWLQEKKYWGDVERRFSSVEGFSAVQPSVSVATRNVEQALSLLAEAIAPVLELQRGLGEVQGRLQRAMASVDGILQALREDLYRRSGFPIPSREYVTQFTPELLREMQRSAAQVIWPDRRFLQTYGWVLFLQVVATLLLFRVICLKREALCSSERWQFLATRPLSAAVFVGFSVFAPLYGAVGLPLWRLLLWTITAISAARLLGGVVTQVWRRRLLYMLAGLFLVTQALRVYGLPLPLFRLYVLAVGVLGVPFCMWRVRVNQRKGTSRWYVLALQLWVAVLGLTALAQLAGYAAFATHLLTASIQTTFVVLLGWMLALLFRGALEFVFGPLFWLHSYAPIRRNADMLVRRFALVADLVVVAVAIGLILEVWRIYASPVEALDAVLGFGITLGGVHLTAGLVLGALGILYAANLISGLIQELLMAEVYPRGHMEWGVRLSMNRLVHYAVIAVGFFAAIGTLGVGFQNITILAGAFGIGIGFGLQNIVNNFVSGLILLFERPIKVGDVVMLDGEWATIKKLGLRATIVQTFGRSDIIVPNSDLVSNKVVNWTLYDRLMRLSIPVGVAYGSDVPLTMRVLEEVGKAHPEVQKEPPPQVIFQSFGGSSLDFELRVWVDTELFVRVNSEIHQEIDRRFREENIEISFPQRDLHLRTVDQRARESLASLLGGQERPGGVGKNCCDGSAQPGPVAEEMPAHEKTTTPTEAET